MTLIREQFYFIRVIRDIRFHSCIGAVFLILIKKECLRG